MSNVRIIDAAKRSFILLKKDPTLLVLFVLPALFPAGGAITTYLTTLVVFGPVQNTPPALSILLSLLYLLVGLFLGAWAVAGAVLKTAELERNGKLGLGRALSRGLRKVPRLLIPSIVTFAIATLMSAGQAAAVIGYPFIGMAPVRPAVGPSSIAFRLAMGFLFLIALYAMVRLRLCAPASVLENNFGLKTSWKLAKGNWWRLFAIILIFLAMSAVISLIPVASVFFIQVRAFFADLIVSPLLIAALTLAYLQLTEAKPRREEEKQPL